MQWNEFISRSHAICVKRDRAWRTFLRRTIKLAALADPRTSGNECLCRNWGNDESKRIWDDAWKRWHSYSSECERRTDAMWRVATGRAAA